jgi:hypothetical protein
MVKSDHKIFIKISDLFIFSIDIRNLNVNDDDADLVCCPPDKVLQRITVPTNADESSTCADNPGKVHPNPLYKLLSAVVDLQ